jgi:HD-like signal output (HDOD) protein
MLAAQSTPALPAPHLAAGVDTVPAARAELMRTLGRVRLPDFPAQHQRILDAIRDPRCSPRQLADRVAMSPAIAVQLLRVVNSAAFSLRARISSIPHAVTILGRGPLENLVRSLGVRGALPRWPARFFDRTAFWRGSARRATTARALSEHIEPEHAELAFAGALLAHTALPLLVKARPRTYRDLLAEAKGSPSRLARLEREAFGYDHREVGGLLATAWSFPEELRACILGPHASPEALPLGVLLVAELGDEPDERLDLDAMMIRACQHHRLPPELVRRAVEVGKRRSQELAQTLS